jgi:lipid-A-disaccharide synthase
MPRPEVFLSAGELSGDMHGAALLERLRLIRPGLTAWGVGGPRLAAAGQEQAAGVGQLSLVGITEVVPRLASIARLISRLKKELARRRPDVVVLVDAPDFNFPLAAAARALDLSVVYFISPQVWAWRRSRIRTLRRTVDLMLCILPFEERLYREEGVRATYVGNPLVDLVHPSAPPDALRVELGLEAGRPVVALLPGSRRTEVRALLPALRGAARRLAARPDRPQFLLPCASPALRPLLAPLEADGLALRVLEGRAWDCLAAADAAVVASGTATLEAALVGTPFVVIYRVGALSHFIARRLVSVPWIGLPNLLLGEPAVRELVQGDCRPEAIAAEITRLLDDAQASFQLRARCAKVRALLGSGGAAARAAAAIARELRWETPATAEHGGKARD